MSSNDFRGMLSTTVLTCNYSTVNSTAYTFIYGQVEPEFHVSREVATLGLSFFVVGLACGPLFLAPLSEFYGRRWIYIVSYIFVFIFIIPCAVAKNIETIIITRFFDGVAGSTFLSVAGGTIGDVGCLWLVDRESILIRLLDVRQIRAFFPNDGVFWFSIFRSSNRSYHSWIHQSIHKLAMDLLGTANMDRSAAYSHRTRHSRDLSPCKTASKSTTSAKVHRQPKLESTDRDHDKVPHKDYLAFMPAALPAALLRANGSAPLSS